MQVPFAILVFLAFFYSGDFFKNTANCADYQQDGLFRQDGFDLFVEHDDEVHFPFNHYNNWQRTGNRFRLNVRKKGLLKRRLKASEIIKILQDISEKKGTAISGRLKAVRFGISRKRDQQEPPRLTT